MPTSAWTAAPIAPGRWASSRDCEGLTAAYVGATKRLAAPFLWRIYELVEYRRAVLVGQSIPLWMAIPLGMNRDDINAAMCAARVRR